MTHLMKRSPPVQRNGGPPNGLGEEAIINAAGILVGQDDRDLGDVVKKFTAPPGCRCRTSSLAD